MIILKNIDKNGQHVYIVWTGTEFKDMKNYIPNEKFEIIYYFTYFSPSSHPTLLCFFPVGFSLLMQHFQQVLWALKFLLPPALDSWKLEFKSLIIVIIKTNKILKTNIYNNQWFKLQLSTAQARRQKKLQHPQDLLKLY